MQRYWSTKLESGPNLRWAHLHDRPIYCIFICSKKHYCFLICSCFAWIVLKLWNIFMELWVAPLITSYQLSNVRRWIMFFFWCGWMVSPPFSSLQGSSKDVGQLAAALHHRILALKSRAEQEPETPTTTIPEAEVPQSNEDDSDEEDNASASASASTPATSEWLSSLMCVFQHSLFYLLKSHMNYDHMGCWWHLILHFATVFCFMIYVHATETKKPLPTCCHFLPAGNSEGGESQAAGST